MKCCKCQHEIIGSNVLVRLPAEGGTKIVSMCRTCAAPLLLEDGAVGAYSPDDGSLSKPPQGGSGVPERPVVGCWLCGALGGGSDPVKCENPACLGKKPQSCVGPASEMPEGLDEGERELWRMTQRLSYLFTERPVKILLQTIAALRAEVAKKDKALNDVLRQLQEPGSPPPLPLELAAGFWARRAREEIDRLRGLVNDMENTEVGIAVRERDTLRTKVETLKEICAQINFQITQALGKTLGYPWYKDDPKSFPGATEADGVCVGEHVTETLADEAAAMLTKKDTALRGLLAEENNLTTALDAEHAEHCSNDKNRAEWKADMERTEQAFAAARAVVPSGPAPRSIPEPTPPPGPGKPRYRSCPDVEEGS